MGRQPEPFGGRSRSTTIIAFFLTFIANVVEAFAPPLTTVRKPYDNINHHGHWTLNTAANRQEYSLPTQLCLSVADKNDSPSSSSSQAQPQPSQQDRLLSLLSFLLKTRQQQQQDASSCGIILDPNDKEQALVASIIAEVEASADNLVTKQNGNILHKDLVGDWNLLYTSSRSMKINQSLSGLGRSSSELAQVVRLTKKFGGSKFLGKVEFVEVFGQPGQEDASLEVFVSGEWYTKPERNPFTGTPTTAIVIEPAKVIYGPSTNDASDWASLGPIKLVDILFLSDKLMICRNAVNLESLFVWQRDNPQRK